MMNPWDRDRQLRDSMDDRPSGFASGLAWIIAIILGVLGMVVVARTGCRNIAVVPVVISLFFIVMFLVGHRREQRRLQAMRWLNSQPQTPPADAHVAAPQPLPRADDASLRRLYDRFDVLAIDECRRNTMEAKGITAFLEMARDFVDTAHAAQLIQRDEMTELDRHMNAALERAKLQYELGNPGTFKAAPKPRYDLEDPPF